MNSRATSTLPRLGAGGKIFHAPEYRTGLTTNASAWYTDTMTKAQLAALRKRLDDQDVKYRQIAHECDVTWSMVWKVLHGARTSARVLNAAIRLSA